MKTILLSIIALLLLNVGCRNQANKQDPKSDTKKRPNILFLSIDDLRPELGCYGSQIAVSPNLDKLAESGMLFNRAYCQQAICGPSRASLMTGARPESIGITHNYVLFRDGKQPDIVTLPQHFRNNGYKTVYCGKIYHANDTDEELSWSREPAVDAPEIKALPKPTGFALPENLEIRKKDQKAMYAKYGEQAKYGLAMGPAYECADVPDQAYWDGYNTDLAIATMKDMLAKNPDTPFFLGLGMKKPHLNFVAPKKYWDMYNPEDIPMPVNTNAPENGASVGLHASFELRVRSGIPKKGDLGSDLDRTLMHAYLACVSYLDAQLGRMIDALEEAGIRENTVIIVWSDHGFHLGEMGVWGKATNYEIATRVPMMIWTPEMPDKYRGLKSDALVELIDMYPTLCELAGLELPEHLEGQSFVPLLNNPSHAWKTAAFSQFPTPALREWGAIALRPGMRETYFGPLITDVEDRIKKQFPEKWDRELFEQHLMGYSMRNERYRFIVWKDRRYPEQAPLYLEVYDHKTDPHETKNIAPEQPELVSTLMTQFNKGWKGNSAKIDLNSSNAKVEVKN